MARSMGARPAWLVVLALLFAGCASGPRLSTALGEPPPPAPLIRFGVDTFAFKNESRSKNPDKPDLYANYCFVMARAVTQFHRFARFDPDRPRVSPEAYTALAREVTSHDPWEDPLPAAERVVIPGYPSLHALSRDHEVAIKAGLPARFWTLVHWTNWRIGFPFSGAHQERVAVQTLGELRAGHLVQLLVTNFPEWELNHTVLVYDYRIGDNDFVEFVVYDPNDPDTPGAIAFDGVGQRFVATRLYDTSPGAIRAFRMYYSPLL